MNRRTVATILVGDCIIPLRTSMGDAMMNRPLIARLETVLRHRRRNTRKQRSQKRDNLQGGHLHALLSSLVSNFTADLRPGSSSK